MKLTVKLTLKSDESSRVDRHADELYLSSSILQALLLEFHTCHISKHRSITHKFTFTNRQRRRFENSTFVILGNFFLRSAQLDKPKIPPLNAEIVQLSEYASEIKIR
jgi:hypothetical protein